ncbi:competence protein ComEA [Motilibacter peucedani]|uniref:Competence protein ComEA n=1 Tax=Motilibacter peucedani TaxID=598650 RepID=A0A420XNX1_9ACTN|nr:competence protein ComEA [Motilibacter peucedani]
MLGLEDDAGEPDEPFEDAPVPEDWALGGARGPGAHRARRPARSTGRLRAALTDRLPVTIRAGLVAVPPAAAVTLVVVVAVAGLAVAGLWALHRPSVTAAPPRVVAGASAPAGVAAAPAGSGPSASGAAPQLSSGTAAQPSPGAAAGAPIVVDVAGRVRRPGVVDLPPGSRVVDAIDAAGGALPGADLRPLNLARKLSDGEQVLVLAGGEVPPVAAAPTGGGASGSAGGVPSGATGTSPGSPLDLNAATVQQFDGLPGVGPVLAQRIVDWRTAHGRFTAVTELQEVTGIGASRFEDLKDLVRV